MKNWSDIPGCILHVSTGKDSVVDVPTLKCFEVVFSNILVLSVSLGVFALFVMMLVGGFRYLTAGGDPKAVAGAQQTMLYAVVGIALLSVAYLIFKLIEFYTGVTITKFTIPS